MVIGARMKKIREIRGMNQKIIASKLAVTPQTYKNFEEDPNLKYSTIKKFCNATEIDPSFLLAEDVPISEGTIHFFDGMKGKSFLLFYEQLRQKVEVYSEVLKLSPNE